MKLMYMEHDWVIKREYVADRLIDIDIQPLTAPPLMKPLPHFGGFPRKLVRITHIKRRSQTTV